MQHKDSSRRSDFQRPRRAMALLGPRICASGVLINKWRRSALHFSAKVYFDQYQPNRPQVSVRVVP